MNIDTICQMTTRPETLNAFHACRDGHPLGRGNNWKWRNAASMAFLNRDISMTARAWLETKATEERLVNPVAS